MFKITEFNITCVCDECKIDLKDCLTIEDVNTLASRYHLCQDCRNKLNGREGIKIQSGEM